MNVAGQERLAEETREEQLYGIINQMLNTNKFVQVIDDYGRRLLLNTANINSLTLTPMNMSIKTTPTV